MKTLTIRKSADSWSNTIFEREINNCFEPLNADLNNIGFIIYNNEFCINESNIENNEMLINSIVRASDPICDIEIVGDNKIDCITTFNANFIKYKNVNMVLLTVDDEIDGLYFNIKDKNIFL